MNSEWGTALVSEESGGLRFWVKSDEVVTMFKKSSEKNDAHRFIKAPGETNQRVGGKHQRWFWAKSFGTPCDAM